MVTATIRRHFAARLPQGVSADDCWHWPGPRNADGYGLLNRTYAHRLAFELVTGPIAPDREVDHLCFVRDCVNPRHLRAIPTRENRANQRSASKTHCINGHEYNYRNTYRRAHDGRRDCRLCIAARQRACRARKAA